MNTVSLNSGDILSSGHGTLFGSLIPELGTDGTQGLLDLMEKMGPSQTTLAFQDVVSEFYPSESSSLPQSPITIPGINHPFTPQEHYSPPQIFSTDSEANAVDSLTGQAPGELSAVNPTIQTEVHTTSEQQLVLWGVDAADGQLFRLENYEDPSTGFEDYGQLYVVAQGKRVNLKRTSAFTIDLDNQTAYLAINKRIRGVRGPWIGKIDLGTVQSGGPNPVTLVGRVDLSRTNDPKAKINGLDIDPVTGELYGLLTEEGNDDLIILSKETGRIIDNIGSMFGSGETADQSSDLVFDADGTLYVIDSKEDELYRVNRQSRILETVDSHIRTGLGFGPRQNLKIDGLAWDSNSHQLVFAETRRDLLGTLSLGQGENRITGRTQSLGLKRIEGIDFQVVGGNSNLSPDAIADNYTVEEDNILSVALPNGILANDRDPENDSLTARLITGPTQGFLNLEPQGSFSYTPDSNFNGLDQFIYEVSDGNGGSDTATVELNVTPVNDAPIILDQSFTIDENSLNESLVGSLTASDIDLNDVLNFRVTGGTGSTVFALDSVTGVLTVADETGLDFEVTPSFTLEVEVEDNQGDIDTATVTVALNDRPENAVPIVNDQSFTVAENSASGTSVGSVLASDSDVGDSLTYFIADGNSDNRFSLDASTGEITLNHPPGVDFETLPQYTLTVQVEDEAGLSDSAIITVNVSDVNESPIIADQGFDVDENSINGTVVGILNANDPDAGDILSYQVIGGTGQTAFDVDANTGDITVLDSSQLDFELSPSFTLDLEVTDSQGLTDTATITITLNNLAENEAPIVSDQSFSIAENSADGTMVGLVVASDPNVGDILSYSIIDGNADAVFTIDSSSGAITLNSPPGADFENLDKYELTVQVVDNAGLSNTATVTINVGDVNEAPVIEDQAFVVPENSPNGTVLGQLVASDPDAGDALAFQITGGTGASIFQLESGTGELTVLDESQLDFETNASFTLDVEVMDQDGLMTPATITIALTDVSENVAPIVNDQGFSVAENSAIGTMVGQIIATDPNAGDSLTYSIIAGNTDDIFLIDSTTGEVTVNDPASLDFETVSPYSLTIQVEDSGGLTDTAMVTVSLTDVNEAPVIEDQSFTIPEDIVNGAVVGLVSASDVDAGDSLGFAITAGNEAGIFEIDPSTGEISVIDASQLDFDVVSGYSLTVTAMDSGSLIDTGVVTINVTDVVNGIVLAEQSFFKVIVEETIAIPSGPSVLTFRYTDLNFDTSVPDFINDAFEAALVDESGNSLVHTIGGDREAFFNLTEGETPSLANGVSLDGQTVSVNLAGVPTGTQATLILRLVNNDEDVTTSVRITDIWVEAAAIAPASGVTPDAGAVIGSEEIDFSSLSDISPSFNIEYGQTSFSEKTDILFASIAIRNDGQYLVDTPLLVVFDNFSDPIVRVREADGLTPEGLPYFDFSNLVNAETLKPGEVTPTKSIEFFNPQGVQFNYEVIVLGQLNQSPVFTSEPDREVVVGKSYIYDADAIDANGDTITYSLLNSSNNLTIDSLTGVIRWEPSANDLGTHAVTLQVDDGRGGITEQSITISVIEAPPNRPPIFTSIPVVDGDVQKDYLYKAIAKDVDSDMLTYSLVSAPKNMIIDPKTGELDWLPDSSQIGFNPVVVSVNDGQGGITEQIFRVLVQPEPNNDAPIIISTPLQNSVVNSQYMTDIDALDPNNDTLRYSVLTAPTTLEIDPNTGKIGWDVTVQDAGQHLVEIQVADDRGGFDTQSFMIEVASLNSGSIQGTKFNDLNGDGERGYLEIESTTTSDPTEDTILLLRFEESLGSVGPILQNAGYEIIIGSLQKPGSIASILAENTDINQIWVWNDGFSNRTPANPNFSFSSEDLSALEQFSLEHPNFIFDGLAWRNHSTQDEENLTLNQVINLFDAGGGIVLGTDDAANGLVVQHVNEITDFFDFDPFEGVYFTRNSFLIEGGTIFNSPNLVRPTELRSSTLSYSEVPHGEQPNGKYLSTSVFGSPVFTLTGYDSPLLSNDILDGIEYRNVNHLITSTIPEAGIDKIPEPGLEDWIIYLDQNNNAQRDEGERFTITDANGHYSFLGLETGEYIIREEQQSGWMQTTNPDAQVTTITNIESITGIDFGNIETDRPENRKPIFNTTPKEFAPINETYIYSAAATDPDHDALTYSLSLAPKGMIVDPQRGIVVWEPTTKQLGTHNIILRVIDGQGKFDLQAFQVTVEQNILPFITSQAVEKAAITFPYQYQILAQDADGTIESYRLDNGPDAMLVDSSTGILTWTPTSEQLGTTTVELTVIDDQDGETSQSFSIEVVATLPNEVPEILSNPRTVTQLQKLYTYQLVAEDPNGDPLSYALMKAPDGMVINQNGVVSWQPEAAQIGPNEITLQVNDGRGGALLQTFSLNVVSQSNNQLPEITSVPRSLNLTVGKAYEYDAQAIDPDNDIIFWSLDQAPAGVSIDPERGALRWTPTADQVGTFEVTILATDSQGGLAGQGFNLMVRGANLPPQISSTPLTTGAVDRVYNYVALAQDSEGDTVTFSLSNAPEGMTIDSQTGLISWAPTSAQLGSQAVTVEVSDRLGATAEQTFSIVVSETAINKAPAIVSQPQFAGTPGEVYSYLVMGLDPDGDALSYQLLDGPAGMTIDAVTGELNWRPAAAGTYNVAVGAVDPGGLGGAQLFTLTVANNNAPVILSVPLETALAGQIYRYDVRVQDPDGDTLAYELSNAPEGMTIDDLGRIRWTPEAINAGVTAVEVIARDPRGAESIQSFNVTVSVDDVAPLARVVPSIQPVGLGESVTLYVSASDDVGVEQLNLTVNGEAVPLTANGLYTFTPEVTGEINAVVTATDAAANSTQAESTFAVLDFTDAAAPVIELPALGDQIFTGPTEIIGTVSDDNLQSYTLSVAPLGTEEFTEIFSGTEVVTNDVLGIFDPTLLQNNSYILRLTATDFGGNVVFLDETVSVAGDLKLGNFQLSFTDLEIPVNGIPISVTRTYDSLNANQNNDFGYGWRMEFRNIDLRTSLGSDELLEFLGLPSKGFRDGEKIYITLPGGDREVFTFKPEPLVVELAGQQIPTPFYTPNFQAEDDSSNSLTVKTAGVPLRQNQAGEYFSMNGYRYNPAAALAGFGGYFDLTTKEGIVYRINGESGKLDKITDRNDNILTFSDRSVTSSTGIEVLFERDAQNRIIAVIDPEGNRITYDYNALGDLVSATDREGDTTRFDYNDDRLHYLDEIIDPLGRSGIRTEYDDEGRLLRMIDADGNPVQLSYDPDNDIQQVTDQLGNITTYEYDERGNVLQEVAESLGEVITRTYDENNNMLTETDPLGNTMTFTYDDDRNVLTETDTLGNVTRYSYDRLGNVLSTTDPTGLTITNTYDDQGNLIQVEGQASGPIDLEYDAAGNLTQIRDTSGVTTFGYNLQGNITRQVDAVGTVTTSTYDSRNNRLSDTTTQTLADGSIRTLVTRMEYDDENRLVKTIDAEGGITETIYDAGGQRVEEIDALGRSTKYIYDDQGQRIATIYPDATPETDKDNPRTQTVYDAKGRVISEIDELGRVTRMVYDALDRQLAMIYPDETPGTDEDNPRMQMEYDAAGRKIADIDPRGNRTEYIYDDAGRLIETILPDETPDRDEDNPRFTTNYDEAGREIAQTDALGQVTRFIYDELGRPFSQEYNDGTRTSTEFDDAGHVVARIDQTGIRTRYEYDELGRLIAVIDALEQQTEYIYDEQGNLITQTDANGNVTRYEYDGIGRRIAMVLPLGQRETYEYDAVGNQIKRTDFNGDVTEYTYDERNRLVFKDLPNEEFDESYSYTDNNLRETVVDNRGITTYRYDEQDRLIERKDPDSRTIAYVYDIAGNRTSVEIPSGKTSYTFDAQDRLKTVIDPESGTTTYFYNRVGNLERTVFPNGTEENRIYDDLNRLIFIETTGPEGVIASFRYTLDDTGNRLSVDEYDGRRVEYNYDSIYRLTKETIFNSGGIEASRTIEYIYDQTGNRLRREDSVEGTTSYTYDNNDQLLIEITEGESIVYSYDKNGNTVAKVIGEEAIAYIWNANNHLIGVDISSDNIIDVSYQYNVDSVRISETISGEENLFLIDSNRSYTQVLEEYSQDGNLEASYVYGHDLITNQRGDEKSFYHVDGLGSTIAISNSSGSIIEKYSYDVFGRRISQSNIENLYQFAGEQYDDDLDLQYLRARYLNINTGRFLSQDPFKGFLNQPVSLHNYIYANNNPALFTDPSGKFSLVSILIANKIRAELAESLSIAGLQSIVRTSKVSAFVIEPAVILQGVGLSMIGANRPAGFGVYNIGNQLYALGFRAINDVIIEIYRDSIDKYIEDEFDFEEFDDGLEDLIDSVQKFINDNNFSQYLKDGKGGKNIEEDIEQLIKKGQDYIDDLL